MNPSQTKIIKFKYLKTKKTKGGMADKKKSICATPIRILEKDKRVFTENTAKSTAVGL